MKRLWAPWRKIYIRPEQKSSKGCLCCRLQKQKNDSQNYLLYSSTSCYAVLNLYPYNNGHILIVPNRHVAKIHQLTSEEKLDWLNLAEQAARSLELAMKAQGINYGMNVGKAAGAGIPKHLHMHLVPRWNGDTNFMPNITKIKVISESLNSVYASLKPHFKKTKITKR